ncbi:MAG: malonyl-CoA decarboxylase family protein [Caulobacteraceae bacterium]|nr:malonyl-CoA decarboxylase family protein [Caulobacteraceae bacterium]
MTATTGTALVPWSPTAAKHGWLPGVAGLLRRTADRLRRWDMPQPPAQPALLVDLLAAEGDDAAAAFKAGQVLAAYAAADEAGRGAFFEALLGHGPDRALLRRAALDFARDPSDAQLSRLQALADPPRQGLIRRLNAAPGGTAALVAMRADLLRRLRARPELGLVDADFAHVFTSWFNRGFLELRRITWATQAAVLEKLIRYEAVHAIGGWDDLRRRLDPPDRRCFAFFHPQLPEEPLIFVEVALTREVPAAIGPILAEGCRPVAGRDATAAVFYSISNCQAGLKGIAFGNLLIKQTVLELKAELPGLKQFCTLSPVPGFLRWLRRELDAGQGKTALAAADLAVLALLGAEGALECETVAAVQEPLARACARYLVGGRGRDGKPLDPVARFHLGNGARLERVNAGADLSPHGLGQSAGVMVNYLYDPAEIGRHRDAFAAGGAVAASRRVRSLAL